MVKTEFSVQGDWLHPENERDAEAFIKHSIASKNIGWAQRDKYRTTIKFFEKFSKKVLRNLTVAELTDLKIALMATGYAENSLHDRLVVARMFYLWLDKGKSERWEVLKPMNVRDTRISEKEVLTHADIDRLMEAAGELRLRAFIRFLYLSGATSGEFSKMNVEDGEVKRSAEGYELLYFNIKGTKNAYRPRFICVSSDGRDIALFREYCRMFSRVDSGQALWVNCWGTRLSPESLISFLKDLKKKTGFEKRLHPHWFRHSRYTNEWSKLPHLERCYSMGWCSSTRESGRYGHAETEAQAKAFLEKFPPNSEIRPPEEQLEEELFDRLLTDDKVISAVFERAVELGLIPKVAQWEKLIKAKKR